MKTLFTTLLLLLSFILFSQPDKVVGEYKLVLETKDNNRFEYQLQLSQDGTFSFQYYSKITQGIPPEKTMYGKGKWSVENNVISFFTEKEKDINDKHTLDFANSKARFIIKSPRDKTDRIVNTKLIFLKSEIFWMERIEMLKV
jgi:hypothetical protein